MNKKVAMGTLISILALPSSAEFTDSCGLYAQMLWTSATTYSSAKSDYQMEKSNYESACNQSYGYSKNDTSACGQYGYVINAYNDAVDRVNSAKLDFESALNNVAVFCGTPDAFHQLYRNQENDFKSIISGLEKQVKQLEAENEALKNSVEN